MNKTAIFCIMLFVLNFSNTCANEQALLKTVLENIDEMKKGISYVIIPLHYSNQEMALIEKLKVNQEGRYRYCEKNLEKIYEELPIFLRDLGNDDDDVIATVTEAVYRTASAIAIADGKNAAWVELRARLPNHEFDLLRWHTDDFFFPPYEDSEDFHPPEKNPELRLKFIFRFATVLKGPATLFYNLSEDERKHFEDHRYERKYLTEWLAIEGSESPTKEEGVLFITGKYYPVPAAVHSEPKIDQPRLFFSVVPLIESDVAWMNKYYFRKKGK